MTLRALLSLAVSGAFAFSTVAFASETTAVFDRVKRFGVKVIATDSGGKRSLGSGVVIGPNEIVTNCHVVGKSLDISVEFQDGELSKAALSGQIAEVDLCLLAARTGNRTPAEIAQLKSVRVGQRVFALGNPLALSQTFSDGIVSGMRQMQQSMAIQITAPISPGSSGGGLFDVSGRLVGITTFAAVGGQNLNFAIPAEYVRSKPLIPTPIASGSDPGKRKQLTFKGLAFGSPLEEFAELFPGALCEEVREPGGATAVVCSGGPVEYLGRPGAYDAKFIRRRLSTVVFHWNTLNDDPNEVARQLEPRIVEHLGVPWLRNDSAAFNAIWLPSDGQEFSLRTCLREVPIFCPYGRSVQAFLSDKRFTSSGAPKTDF